MGFIRYISDVQRDMRVQRCGRARAHMRISRAWCRRCAVTAVLSPRLRSRLPHFVLWRKNGRELRRRYARLTNAITNLIVASSSISGRASYNFASARLTIKTAQNGSRRHATARDSVRYVISYPCLPCCLVVGKCFLQFIKQMLRL
jgi:hypothetical protein